MITTVLRVLRSEDGLSAATYAAILGVIAVGYVVACRLLLG